jgi:monoamine oxidase
MTKQRIVVVGAGVAGLAAARALRRRGYSVIVLEARPQIGGRILTRQVRTVPAPIELGAEFIHGEAPETMRVVRAAGLHVEKTGGDLWIAHGGKLRPANFGTSVDRVFRLIDPRAPDESFAQFLARRPGGRALAKNRVAAESFVEGFHAADPRSIGARCLAPVHGQRAGGAATTAARLADGQDAIPRWLAQELAGVIRTRAVVTEIAWSRHHAQVRVRDGARGVLRTVRARAVVVTVPIGVLHAAPNLRGGIAFRPEPVSVRNALSRIGMGSVTKVVFAFEELPWSRIARARRGGARPDVGFVRTPGGEFGVWWASGSRTRLAVAWSGGPPAAALDRRRSSEIVATALQDLARGLGESRSRLEKGVRGAWLHHWQHDPYSRGAYSYPLVGGLHAGHALARPVEGTLFFAGEATSRAWGTVEGALASGLRAARQVEAALGRR